MTVSISLQINRTIPSASVYRVALTVAHAVDIDREIFVFGSESETFSHFAAVYDMETYPAEKTTELAYYRQSSAVVDFSDVSSAIEFETVARNRIKILVTAWETITEAFASTETVTIDSTS